MSTFSDPGDGTILRAWIRAAKEHGYELHSANDGEDDWAKVRTEKEAFEIVNSVDESYLKFRNAEKQSFTLYIILNNGIGSPVTDIYYSDSNAEVVQAIGDLVDPVQDRVDESRSRR